MQEAYTLYKRLIPATGEIDAKNGLAVLKLLADMLDESKTPDETTVQIVDDLANGLRALSPWGNGKGEESEDDSPRYTGLDGDELYGL